MKINAIDTTLSETDLEALKTKINDIKLLMPFLISLTVPERRSRFKMSNKRFDFVSQVINTCAAEPAVIPNWIDVKQLERDYTLSNQLLGIENLLQGILSDVKDTRMQLGSEALQPAVDVYMQVQQAKDRIPGVLALYNILKASYPGRGKNKKKDQK